MCTGALRKREPLPKTRNMTTVTWKRNLKGALGTFRRSYWTLRWSSKTHCQSAGSNSFRRSHPLSRTWKLWIRITFRMYQTRSSCSTRSLRRLLCLSMKNSTLTLPQSAKKSCLPRMRATSSTLSTCWLTGWRRRRWWPCSKTSRSSQRTRFPASSPWSTQTSTLTGRRPRPGLPKSSTHATETSSRRSSKTPRSSSMITTWGS